MTSKEALSALFTEASRCSCEEPKYTIHDLWEMAKQLEKDLDLLESLKHLIEDLEITFNTELFSKGGYIGTIIKDYFIDNDVTGKLEDWLKNEGN